MDILVAMWLFLSKKNITQKKLRPTHRFNFLPWRVHSTFSNVKIQIINKREPVIRRRWLTCSPIPMLAFWNFLRESFALGIQHRLIKFTSKWWRLGLSIHSKSVSYKWATLQLVNSDLLAALKFSYLQIKGTKQRNDFMFVIVSQMDILVAMCLFLRVRCMLCCKWNVISLIEIL